MAQRNVTVGVGVSGARGGIGIVVGFASDLISCSSLSSTRFRSPAPAKHLVPTGDEV